MELLLARHALGDIELPADLAGRFEQSHLMTTLGSDTGSRQTSRSCANHSDFLRRHHGDVIQFGFMTGPRVDQAAGELAAKRVIQTGLVAADTGIDLDRKSTRLNSSHVKISYAVVCMEK